MNGEFFGKGHPFAPACFDNGVYRLAPVGRSGRVQVQVLEGPPRCGKSRAAQAITVDVQDKASARGQKINAAYAQTRISTDEATVRELVSLIETKMLRPCACCNAPTVLLVLDHLPDRFVRGPLWTDDLLPALDTLSLSREVGFIVVRNRDLAPATAVAVERETAEGALR